jgi:hypothetical protein
VATKVQQVLQAIRVIEEFKVRPVKKETRVTRD